LKKKVFYSLLVFLFLFANSSLSFAAPESFNNIYELREQKIRELYMRKAELIAQGLIHHEKLDNIDNELRTLGVQFLTHEQAKRFFINNNVVQPLIDVPSQPNVNWSTYTSWVITNGKTYEVQRLVAQPNELDSNLKSSGFKLLSSSYNWKAGTMNALGSAAMSGAGYIPGASLALSVYDVVSSFVSGISKETTITDAEISYTWAQVTTAVFSYVKESDQSDEYQQLTYISTMATVAVGWQYPVFTYINNNGNQVTVQPNVIQGTRTITAIPDGYDSGFNAVDAYLSPYAKKRATVDRIEITGIESKNVAYIYPVSPQFPAHIF
jgi:hypothetical protein